jgi:hypothetical protein
MEDVRIAGAAAEKKVVVVRVDVAGRAGQLTLERGLPSREATTMDAMRRRASRQPVINSGSMLS